MSVFRLAGVMGYPVSHSRSPLLHGHWLKRHAINGAYVPLAVRPEALEAALRGLAAMGFAGCNITVPLKELALTLVDHVDDLARRTGSINTIIVCEDGRLEGRTTDGFGFIQNLMHSQPGWQAKVGPAVILGAGGSARAIAVALLDVGVPAVKIINRTHRRAVDLVAAIDGPLQAVAWEEMSSAIEDAALIVNTTTQGMVGQPALVIDLAPLPDSAIVADIVYTPLETPLLKQARHRGLARVDGLGMLLYQAHPGFHAWFGIEPTVDQDLRNALLASLAPSELAS